MIPAGLRKDLNEALRLIAAELDLDDTRYKNAEEKYQAVANWLQAIDSELAVYNPDIYPQGSFALGTVVKPLASDEYDIDLVCELEGYTDTPTHVKQIVGDRLKQNSTYRSILEEMNRCWRLAYAGDFHMDTLPAKPDEDRGRTAILIPDKELEDWSQSDPKGYVLWFRERMSAQFNLNRIAIAKSLNKEVEEVPDHKVKTTLQQAVQLLKRNRDIQFADNPENKPISIVITTLAGYSYRNQDDLFSAIVSIATEMPNHITKVGDELWVANPVNPDENFADKWQDHPDRKKAFFDWIENLQNQLAVLEVASTLDDVEVVLKQLFGEGLSSDALKEVSSAALIKSVETSPSQFDVSHRLPLKWEYNPKYQVQVTAIKTAGKAIKGVMPKAYPNNGKPIAKWYSLEFTATTNAPDPYSVEWQVVNTGEEARRANGLRGGFEYSSGTKSNRFIRKESTQYKGSHWIEAFVIKNGICVARSGEFIVNIQ